MTRLYFLPVLRGESLADFLPSRSSPEPLFYPASSQPRSLLRACLRHRASTFFPFPSPAPWSSVLVIHDKTTSGYSTGMSVCPCVGECSSKWNTRECPSPHRLETRGDVSNCEGKYFQFYRELDATLSFSADVCAKK